MSGLRKKRSIPPSSPGVYIEEIPSGIRTITGVSMSVTAFIGYTAKGPVNKAVNILSWGDYERNFGGLHQDSLVSYALHQFFLNGGTNAYVVRVVTRAQTGEAAGDDGTPPGGTEIIGDYDAKSGIYALRDVDIFNIMAIPETIVLNDTEARNVIAKAISFCEKMRAFYLVDYDPTRDFNTITTWVSSLGAQKNAAVFFPQVQVADPLDDFHLKDFPSSGTIAGLFARIDSVRGVWKAPAGTEAGLQDVKSLSLNLTDPEYGVLNQKGINCLRTFPSMGNVCWGARTLEGSDTFVSEWKYIPVRRLALFLEESLFRGTIWVVFEPNDESLWAKIRLNVGAFMMRLFRQGAFQGSTPDKAFYVKCDALTTTQSDREHGIVNIEVGFAPLKPAEFVIIRIQQIANG